MIERTSTQQAIFKICNKRAIETPIPDFSPHDFRCTFGGADIATISDLGGYASIQTAARHERRDRNGCTTR